MFCGKCGAKLVKGTKFCPECGQEINAEIKETEGSGEMAKGQAAKTAGRKKSGPGCLIFILIASIIFGAYEYSESVTERGKDLSLLFIIVPAVILGFWFVIWLIKALVGGLIKKRGKALMIIGIIFFIIVLFTLFGIFYSKK